MDDTYAAVMGRDDCIQSRTATAVDASRAAMTVGLAAVDGSSAAAMVAGLRVRCMSIGCIRSQDQEPGVRAKKKTAGMAVFLSYPLFLEYQAWGIRPPNFFGFGAAEALWNEGEHFRTEGAALDNFPQGGGGAAVSAGRTRIGMRRGTLGRARSSGPLILRRRERLLLAVG